MPVGTVLYLNGNGSDANNDPLTYHWYFSAKPVGSIAVFLNPTQPQTSFLADMEGDYVVSLVANDGYVNSEASLVTITVTPPTPAQAVIYLSAAISTINEMPPETFKSKSMLNPFTNKINATITLLSQGMYQDALKKLENDILPKMDGCAKGDAPDNNDWINTCGAQAQVYPLILNAINALK